MGWVYQYAVLGKNRTLAELRTLQDWYLRYQLTKAQGVAEVASIGGFVQQYQVTVDPVKLRAYGIPLMTVANAIRNSNRDVGGRAIEMAEAEYMVRGRGYLRGIGDLEQLVVKADKGTPVLLRDIARVELGPDERRGVAELNGDGEVVSGIVVARYGQNALDVIGSVKEKMREMAAGLPAGVTIETVYDRSELIERAIATLKTTLAEESLIVALVCIVFLLHVRTRAGGDPDAAGGRADRLHRHARARHELQHHEPRRHRHRHRRDGRCGHRDDRERAQASGAAEGRGVARSRR